MEYLTKSAAETEELGSVLAQRLRKGKKAIVIVLKGDLGAGKTTFLKGLGRELGVKEEIVSPTFVIMAKHAISYGWFADFYHLDCYRLEKESEAEVLGLPEILSNPENIVCVEWPERIASSIPEEAINVAFVVAGEDKRKIIVGKNGAA